MDADYLAIDKLYQGSDRARIEHPSAHRERDRPVANLGWRNMERSASRARPPDLVLALALIHHVVIGGNIR